MNGARSAGTAGGRFRADLKHHPHLMSGGRHGSWCTCPCGWSSGTYGTVTGAHLAFGRHLLDAEHLTRPAHSTTTERTGR